MSEEQKKVGFFSKALYSDKKIKKKTLRLKGHRRSLGRKISAKLKSMFKSGGLLTRKSQYFKYMRENIAKLTPHIWLRACALWPDDPGGKLKSAFENLLDKAKNVNNPDIMYAMKTNSGDPLMDKWLSWSVHDFWSAFKFTKKLKTVLIDDTLWEKHKGEVVNIWKTMMLDENAIDRITTGTSVAPTGGRRNGHRSLSIVWTDKELAQQAVLALTNSKDTELCAEHLAAMVGNYKSAVDHRTVADFLVSEINKVPDGIIEKLLYSPVGTTWIQKVIYRIVKNTESVEAKFKVVQIVFCSRSPQAKNWWGCWLVSTLINAIREAASVEDEQVDAFIGPKNLWKSEVLSIWRNLKELGYLSKNALEILPHDVGPAPSAGTENNFDENNRGHSPEHRSDGSVMQNAEGSGNSDPNVNTEQEVTSTPSETATEKTKQKQEINEKITKIIADAKDIKKIMMQNQPYDLEEVTRNLNLLSSSLSTLENDNKNLIDDDLEITSGLKDAKEALEQLCEFIEEKKSDKEKKEKEINDENIILSYKGAKDKTTWFTDRGFSNDTDKNNFEKMFKYYDACRWICSDAAWNKDNFNFNEFKTLCGTNITKGTHAHEWKKVNDSLLSYKKLLKIEEPSGSGIDSFLKLKNAVNSCLDELGKKLIEKKLISATDFSSEKNMKDLKL